MTSRERTLAIVLLGMLLVGGGGVCGYMFVYSPLQQKKAAAQKLQGEVDDLELKALTMKKNLPQVAEVKRQSLPPDESIAKAQYKLLLERLLLEAKITNYTLPDGRVSAASRSTPEVAAKKPAYRTLTFQIDFSKADIWQIADFLYDYYQLDLLHQITDLRITRENKSADPRNGLNVHITSEAIILDGVEPRSALFPVTAAVAAVAGIPGLEAVVIKPELARRLTTTTSAPVLATRSRDYSWLAQRDMFYGPLPPPIITKPAEFAILRPDNVTMDRNEKPKDVRVRLTGEGSIGAKIEATVSGSLLPEGALTVDPKTLTITIPAIDTDASDYAYSTVSIVATAANGKTAKGSFLVAPTKSEKAAAPTIDIAGVIKLVIVSTASDGTAEAMIKDNANPYRYRISVTTKGIEIIKEWPATGRTWKRDRDYDYPPGVLLISDEETATKRVFKVIAIEHDALIVVEHVLPEPARDAKHPVMPGKGPRLPGGPAKQGPADPLGAIAGNLATAIPQPVYYRWSTGKSLRDLLDPKGKCKLSPEEVKKIFGRVAASGPVPPASVTAVGNE